MASHPMDLLSFEWVPQPLAEELVSDLLQSLLARLPAAVVLANGLEAEAGVRLPDLLDFISLEPDQSLEDRLQKAGFVPPTTSETMTAEPAEASQVFVNPNGIFPTILLKHDATRPSYIKAGIRVESIADFAAVRGLELSGDSDYLPTLRMVSVYNDTERGAELIAVERHGCRGFDPGGAVSSNVQLASIRHLERFRTRRRNYSALSVEESESRAFQQIEHLIDVAIGELGRDRACDLFFAAEREYWQRRNRAAQVQKARQDRLGIGWANHDHHTYRSSRKHFARLVSLWEKLGFHCRERFYAGKEAGWGAQVMEQPTAGIVTFNDVDLSPDELLVDFAHEPLQERAMLGTVGLWCALHGESLLEAGMHHLECTFNFAALKAQLEKDHGISVMKPFTDFPHLKQAFTQGERWPVRQERVIALQSQGGITAEQAQKFLTEGAIGSHLENLERNKGFKGFNQTGVSEIIAATDPRKHLKA